MSFLDRAIRSLSSSSDFKGSIVLPGDAGYDPAREVWNAAADRRPAAIIRPTNADEVAYAVTLARNHGLEIAVRSGGHSVAGHSTVDGGLVIDLSGMKRLSIDPVTRVASAEAGLTWAEYARAANEYGLATSSGDMGTVGLGGLTLGGGIGWMVRKYGLTIDHLLSVELVTSDGDIVTANANENADLFWGLRGGGGNLGIATRFTLRLEEAGIIVGGGVFYPFEQADSVLRNYIKYTATAPNEITSMASIMAIPPVPFIPAEWHFKPTVMIMFCYTGDVEEGMRVAAPLRTLGTPIAEMVSPMPYPVLFDITAEGGKHGSQHHGRNGFSYEIPDSAIDSMVEFMAQPHSPTALTQLRHLGGAMGNVPQDATAFAHRDKQYMMSVFDSWSDPAQTEAEHDWVQRYWQALSPHTSGSYVNFLFAQEGEERIRGSYAPSTYHRLAELKQRYDPSNVFHLNQNIAPSRETRREERAA